MRVILMGGGTKAISLINVLESMKGVVVAGVCDEAKASPAMRHARKTGMAHSADPEDFIKRVKPDIVIVPSVSKRFKKTLNRLSAGGVNVITANGAQLLLNIGEEVKKDQGYEQLHLANELTHIFSGQYDTHNILWPVFDLLKKHFRIDVGALVVFYGTSGELMIVSQNAIQKKAKGQLLGYMEKEISIMMKDKVELDGMRTYMHAVSDNTVNKDGFKTLISMPLAVGGEEEGMLVLGREGEEIFDLKAVVVLNIIGDELTFFIRDERIKKGLAKSKSDLESMLNSMSEGVIALNAAQEITVMNPAAKSLLGITGTGIGRTLGCAVGNKEVADMLETCPAGELCRTREITFIFPDKLKIIRFYAAKVADSLDNPGGWIMLLTDVTKEKEVDKMKSEFISTTSHELRTPLAAIKESVMLVLDGTAGELAGEQGRFLAIAKRNIDRLADLINDLLDISKMESGRMELKKEPCDIPGLIAKVLEPMKILAGNTKVRVECVLGPDLPLVICDPRKITQVVVNLLSNAIKFTPEGGKVTVASRLLPPPDQTKITPGFLEISVSDTGIGIKGEDFSKLFTRFGQLDSSLTRRPGGTGLGLAICKELIAMHSGKIWVESEEGKGSSFIFTLPLDGRQGPEWR